MRCRTSSLTALPPPCVHTAAGPLKWPMGSVAAHIQLKLFINGVKMNRKWGNYWANCYNPSHSPSLFLNWLVSEFFLSFCRIIHEFYSLGVNFYSSLFYGVQFSFIFAFWENKLYCLWEPAIVIKNHMFYLT